MRDERDSDARRKGSGELRGVDVIGGKLTTLADLCESVRYGYTASASLDPCGPRFLRITDIVPDLLDWESVPYCEIDDPDRERFALAVGDIVVARTGATVGYAKLIRETIDAVFASYLVRFRVDPAKADPAFVGRLVESHVYKSFVKSRIGGAAQPNASAPVLGSFEFPLPSRHAQSRIADILSAYDDLIENNRRRMSLLEEAARQLYREWFVRLRFPGHEHTPITNGVPEGWEKRRVEDLAELKGGKQLENDRIAEEGLVPVFGGNGIQGYTSEKTHDGFVIAFGRVGANCGSVHWSYHGAWINNNASGVVPNEHPELFLHHLLNFNFTNLRKGAAQPFIPNGVLATVDFWRPSRTLAEVFCEAVRPLRLQQANLSRNKQKLRAARDLLLPRLMSGEIVV